MQDALESLRLHLQDHWKKREGRGRHSRSYKCRCDSQVFFDNTQCLNCKFALGYLPDEGRVAALQPGPTPDTWIVEGRKETLKSCGNRSSAAGCNWMMFARNPLPL